MVNRMTKRKMKCSRSSAARAMVLDTSPILG
jgi:hypothetical protein